MKEKNTAEMTQKFNQFWYEAGQAIVQSGFDIQNRSMQYVQNSFKDEIETINGHIESAQHWLQSANKRPDQQEAAPSLMNSSVEACKRNIALLQRITEQGTETFKTNTEAVRDLTQTLIKKAQDQQSPFFRW